MNHLLIDLESTSVKLKHIPAKTGSIFLFAKRKKTLKRAIHFAQHHASAEVIDLHHTKATTAIINEIKTLLHDHNARIAIIAKRKKLKQSITALCSIYPNADIALWRKLGKKQLSQLKKQYKSAKKYSHHTSVAPVCCDAQSEHNCCQAKIQTNDKKTISDQSSPTIENTLNNIETTAVQNTFTDNQPIQTVPETNTNITISTDNITDKDIHNAVQILKKNQPKKKIDLLKIFQNSLNIDEKTAVQLIKKLQAVHLLSVDIAENIKYYETKGGTSYS